MFLKDSQNASQLFKIVEAVNSSSILTMTDLQGRIVQANRNFEKISGYTFDELLGQPHSIINSGYHPSHFWTEMWQTVTNGNVWRNEVCNRTKNGSIYWVDTFVYPIQDDAGNIINFLSVRNDITEKKLLTSRIINSESLKRYSMVTLLAKKI